MATADQIKALIRSHVSEDSERFYTMALQLAAHEARQGHEALANEIRDLVLNARKAKRGLVLKLPNEMEGLVYTEEPPESRTNLVVSRALQNEIDTTILEFRQQSKLKAHGLSHRRKLLLIGPPGTGKTMTARVLAHELKWPLYTIQVDRMVTRFMGETGARLRQIFELMNRHPGVYLFDEFDAIGAERGRENEVGEIRRVLNAFLQFIEQDDSDSLILAITNNPNLLDRALFRRFDAILPYELPGPEERKRIMSNLLSVYLPTRPGWQELMKASDGLSASEISTACIATIKKVILSEAKTLNSVDLVENLQNRKMG